MGFAAGQRLARLPGRLRALLIAPAAHQRPLGVWCAPAGWTRVKSAGLYPLYSVYIEAILLDCLVRPSASERILTYFGGLYARSEVRMGSSLAMWSEYFPKGTVVGTAPPAGRDGFDGFSWNNRIIWEFAWIL